MRLLAGGGAARACRSLVLPLARGLGLPSGRVAALGIELAIPVGTWLAITLEPGLARRTALALGSRLAL